MRSSDFETNPALWSFTDQTVLGHAATVITGVVITAVVYGLHLKVIAGDLSLLVTVVPGAIPARRSGLQVAMIACYMWFSVAFMFGKGGPILNFWLYPLVGLLAGLHGLPLIIFNQLAPHEMINTGGFSDPSFFTATLEIFVPGFLFGIGLAGGFIIVLTYILGVEEEWAERHLPAEYKEIDIENYE